MDADEPLDVGARQAAGAPLDTLVIAQVLAAHGIKGELKCRVVTDFPDRFRRGLRVYSGEPPQPYTVAAARLVGDLVYLQLREVQDRTAAEALRGREISIAAADAAPLPEGQFLWRDVIGLEVQGQEGEIYGRVTDILRTGANDVYVVRGDRGEILVPAIKDVVQLIDPPAGRMVIVPLPGLLPEPRSPHQAGADARRTKGPRQRRRSTPNDHPAQLDATPADGATQPPLPREGAGPQADGPGRS